jgi:hypothetical protein
MTFYHLNKGKVRILEAHELPGIKYFQSSKDWNKKNRINSILFFSLLIILTIFFLNNLEGMAGLLSFLKPAFQEIQKFQADLKFLDLEFILFGGIK